MTTDPVIPASPAEWLRLAVEKLGGQNATARFLGVAQPSVWRWVHKHQPLPAAHVLKVEDATGISRHDLNPDTFGPPPALLIVPTEYEAAR